MLSLRNADLRTHSRHFAFFPDTRFFYKRACTSLPFVNWPGQVSASIIFSSFDSSRASRWKWSGKSE
jgi:hypothetical protein